jgi:hypothetical protein
MTTSEYLPTSFDSLGSNPPDSGARWVRPSARMRLEATSATSRRERRRISRVPNGAQGANLSLKSGSIPSLSCFRLRVFREPFPPRFSGPIGET